MPLDNYITLSQLTKSVKGLVNKINGEATVTNNKIGNLANLNTSAKTDLVAAINEVATSSGSSGITQVNADWNATSGVAQILNKPTIPTITSTYNSSGTDAVNGTAVASAIAGITTTSIGAVSSADLDNYVQKKIGNNIDNSQIGQSNSNIDLSVYSGQDGNGSINVQPGEITLTTIKDLGTGKGIVLKTNSKTIATFGPTETTITNIVTPTSDTMAANKKYVDDSVSALSIPTKISDLTNDSGYITSYTETDPTVPSWAKQATKPTYTASEVGALPDTTVIPAAQVQSDWNATSGMGVILNKPTIPAATTVTQTLTSGTKIGEVNGTSLYAPIQLVLISNTLTSGTLIATINGTNIYAPSYTDADGVSY